MSSKKYTIFLVDDDLIFLEMLRETLSEDTRFQLYLFESAELCISQLNMNPDVIILDYDFHKAGLNVMDGLTALKKIKETGSKAKIIMLTAQENPDMVMVFIKNGANDYVIKDEEAFENIKNVLADVIDEIEKE